MTVHSNENVTEKRGGNQALLASRAWLPPRFSVIFRPAVSFLLIKPLLRLIPCFESTAVLSLGRSLHATVAGWSVHRAFASAALPQHCAYPWLCAARKASGLDPTCDAPCLRPPSF